MAAPQTQIGKRRLRILQTLAGGSRTVAYLSARLGFCPKTVLNHLHGLESFGYVERPTNRAWRLAPGISLRGFDGTALDKMEP